jgi:hypothetical protein
MVCRPEIDGAALVQNEGEVGRIGRSSVNEKMATTEKSAIP